MTGKTLMTIEDALRLRLMNDSPLSPDGSAAVYVVPELDEESKEYRDSLWWVSTVAALRLAFTARGVPLSSRPVILKYWSR